VTGIWEYLKKHPVIAFVALFLLALVVAIVVYVAYFVINFIAGLVVGSGIEGSFALHHGLVGLIVFAVSIYGVYYLHYYEGERNSTYNFFLILCISFAAFGLLLMFNDIYDLPLWFLFRH